VLAHGIPTEAHIDEKTSWPVLTKVRSKGSSGERVDPAHKKWLRLFPLAGGPTVARTGWCLFA